MNEEEVKGKIEGLNEKLYSRTRYRDPSDRRAPVGHSSDGEEVKEGWQSGNLDEILAHERVPDVAHPFMKKLFIFSLVFFFLASAAAWFVFQGGSIFVSSKNVDINILGPSVISAGEVLELGLNISNRNNADLELANLSIQYPTGTRNPDNTAEPLTYTKEDLGVIGSGEEIVRNIRAVLLGSPGETMEIKFSIEYKVKGSNATFYKDKIFEVAIGEASVELSVEMPRSTISGENVETSVTVKSKSKEVLKNIVLKAEYPYGFSVSSVEPTALADNNFWVLGDLSPGDVKTITIKGRLVGEDGEERTMRFYVGVSDDRGAFSGLKIVLASLLDTISIERKSIGLNISFNGESASNYIAPAGRQVNTSVTFRNNFSDKLLNPKLEVSFSGSGLDKVSVVTGSNGRYNSGDAKALWDLTNNIGATELSPGESGRIDFRFASLPELSLPEGGGEIKIDFLVTATPVGSVGSRPIAISESRTIKISSQINFSAKVLHSLGSFANTGPIPPKMGEETTYTIVLSAGNTKGDISESKVTASLGPSVKYVGASSFLAENISYDESSNTVNWDIGNLSAGTGFSSSNREVSFQVSLVPTLGQIGTAPTLVTGIVFSGLDNSTASAVKASASALTTRLTEDPIFIQGDEIVVE